MNKICKVLIVIVCTLTCRPLFAEKVLLAPVVAYDEHNKKLDLEVNANRVFYEKLNSYWFEGKLTFEYITESKYGAINSVVDAQRVCSISESQYIVYGYFQKNSNSWYGNLKLYDNYAKKVSDEFFVSDSLDNYDRFIETLNERILEGMEKLLGFTELQLREEKRRPFEVRLPVTFSYWSPLGDKWNDVYMGIAGGSLGCEIFPSMKNNVFHTLKYDYSGLLRGSYEYGKENEGGYPLNLHKISIDFPVLFHLYFSNHSSIYAGTGFFYEFEIMQITEKYSQSKNIHQSLFGVLGILGYELSVNDFFKIRLDVETDFHISDDRFIEIKPSLGFVFSLFRERKND